jgi:hypothetical protein
MLPEASRPKAGQIGLAFPWQSTARVLFRRVFKAVDQKDFVIAQHERRI